MTRSVPDSARLCTQRASTRLGQFGYHARPLRVLLSVCLPLALPGCPLQDDYYIDEGGADAGGSNVTSGTAGLGSGATGEAADSGAGGAMTGAASGGAEGGTAGTAGTAGTDPAAVSGAGGQDLDGRCSPTRCSGACCGDECVELDTDPEHCGTCGSVCGVGRSCEAGQCEAGWLQTSAPPDGFPARVFAASVEFEGKAFIFGGTGSGGVALNDGAIYDPATDSWTLIARDDQTPSPRELATALWTGTALIVVGGREGSTYFDDGARYDPANDRWTRIEPMSQRRASMRGGATASELVLWGGVSTSGYALAGGEVYDVAADRWSPMETSGGPGALLSSAASFSGEALMITGGLSGMTRTGNTYRYTLADDTWTTWGDGPSPRSAAFAASDGDRLFVWGGAGASTAMGGDFGANTLGDGWLRDGAWGELSEADAPTPRLSDPLGSGWCFALGAGDFALLGGRAGTNGWLVDGGRYRVGSGWTRIDDWPSEEDHQGGVGLLVGDGVFIWGGMDDGGATTTGEHWRPSE